MKKQLQARLEALSRELANGYVVRARLEAQLKVLNEQMFRIEGAKILAEELMKETPEPAHQEEPVRTS